MATTTEGAPCRPGGWTGKSASLCVLLYRSKTLAKGSWVLGNSGQPIVQPGDSGADNDRKIMPQVVFLLSLSRFWELRPKTKLRGGNTSRRGGSVGVSPTAAAC